MTGREPDAATESHRNWLRRAGSGDGGTGHEQDRVRHAARSVNPLVLGEKRVSEPHPLTDDPRQRDTAAAGTSRVCLKAVEPPEKLQWRDRKTGSMKNEFCIDSLVQYMRKLPGCPDVSFREESDDPPDFWLSVAGREFAVEVTAITTGADYHNRTRELLQAVKEDSPSDCTWQGAYALQISRRPEIPKRNSKAWKQLVAQASSTISSLVSQPAGTVRTLLSDGRGKLQIVKLSEKSDFGFNLADSTGLQVGGF